MRALDPEVVDAIFVTIEDLLPQRPDTHPLGCHRPRVSDRLCFRGLLIRLVTGSSWVDIEAILGHTVSDTTLRARRDEGLMPVSSMHCSIKHSPRSTGSLVLT